MPVNGTDLMTRLDALAQFSEESHQLTRTYLTDAHYAAGEQIKSWMRDAGMQTRTDAAANVIGRYEAQEPDAPALLIGSHYDTVRNAGKFDGNLGVLAGIACVEILARREQRLPFAIEVIGFSEEEGVRYNATLLGSRAVADTFDKSLLDTVDAAAISMRDALRNYGLDASEIESAAYRSQDVLGYVELHIEQGPVLIDRNVPVGVVSAIAGASRYHIKVTGLAGHAGTVPMSLRRDAAAAAAEAVLLIEQACAASESVVGTVGQLQIPGGSANVIAGYAEFSLDVRAGDDAHRLEMINSLFAGFKSIEEKRQVSFQISETHSAPAAICCENLQAQLSSAIQNAGISPVTLTSGAGHDAMAMAALTQIAMLFVRCGNGGISHHPSETVSLEDVTAASNVLLDFIVNFKP